HFARAVEELPERPGNVMLALVVVLGKPDRGGERRARRDVARGVYPLVHRASGAVGSGIVALLVGGHTPKRSVIRRITAAGAVARYGHMGCGARLPFPEA